MALAASDDLITRMKESSASSDPVRGLMANLFLQRHNIPYLTTLYEADAEMMSGLDMPKDKRSA